MQKRTPHQSQSGGKEGNQRDEWGNNSRAGDQGEVEFKGGINRDFDYLMFDIFNKKTNNTFFQLIGPFSNTIPW